MNKPDFWKTYATDEDLSENGVWIDDFEGGVSVKIRSPRSMHVRSFRRKLEEQEPFRVAIAAATRKRKSIPPELEHKLSVKVAAGAIVADWKGIPDQEGNPMPYSAENAEFVFNSLPEFYEDVLFAASTRDAFKSDAQVEEDEGNF